MQNLLLVLLPIAVVDSFNPTATAMIVLLLATPKPVARVSAAIAGFGVAYFAFGVLVVLGASSLIAQVSGWFASPPPIYYLFQFGLGLVLLLFATRQLRAQPDGADQAEGPPARWLGSPVVAFGLGAALNIGELPTAFPYLAALERVTFSGVGTAGVVVALAVYAFIFVLPLIILLLVYVRLRERAALVIGRINDGILRWSRPLITGVSFLLGGALLADSLSFMLRGEGLWA
ncbi:MAG: GAP family protein [Anaerolineae bacterium]|nr:GAP family protein [Anaerolineae bacterium]